MTGAVPMRIRSDSDEGSGMARIRTIKPDFFTSEDIVGLSPLARLLYIATWLEADREGRFVWRPKTLKLRYLPGDECDIDALAGELVNAGLVVTYEIEGQEFAEIPAFTKHQVINNRESESQIPSRVIDATTTRGARVNDATATPLIGREGKGKEGKEIGQDAHASPSVRKTKKDEISLAQFLENCKVSGEQAIPEDDPVWEYSRKVGITEEMIAVAWREFKSYWLTGDGKAKRKTDWRRTFLKSVQDNRARLWFVREGEQAQWTTAGEQARRAAA